MNRCFLIGKIVSELGFKFVVNSKIKSICFFKIELSNNSIVEIVGYNLIADSCYRRLKKGMYVTVEGMIENKGRFIVIEIVKYILNKSEQ